MLGGELRNLNDRLTVPQFLDRLKDLDDVVVGSEMKIKAVEKMIRRMIRKTSDGGIGPADHGNFIGAAGELSDLALLSTIDGIEIKSIQASPDNKDFREAFCEGAYPSLDKDKVLRGEWYSEVKTWPTRSEKSGVSALRTQIKSHFRRAIDGAGKYDRADEIADWPGLLYRFPAVKDADTLDAFQKAIENAVDKEVRAIIGDDVPNVTEKVEEFLKKVVVEAS